MLGAACILSACSLSVDETQTARTQMLGMKKSELLDCAGLPTRDAYGAAKETLTYVRTEMHGDFAFTCQADFTIYRDRVEHVAYEGLERRLFGPPTPCINIVKSCLK